MKKQNRSGYIGQFYHELKFRKANLFDTDEIFKLLDYYHEKGFIKKISHEQIRERINDFFVVVKGVELLACACIQLFSEEKKAFISSVAVSAAFTNLGLGTELVNMLERRAKENSINRIFLVSRKSGAWWIKRGFVQGELECLPEKIKADYMIKLRSVLLKWI